MSLLKRIESARPGGSGPVTPSAPAGSPAGGPGGAGACPPPAPPAGEPAGALGVTGPDPPGLALSIRFSRDIVQPPLQPPMGRAQPFLAPCEQRLSRSLLAGPVARLLRLASQRSGEAKNVLRDLRFAVAQEERYSPVERIHNTCLLYTSDAADE